MDCFTHRLVTVTGHTKPSGGSINQVISHVESQAGGILVPCIAVSRVGVTCSVNFQSFATPGQVSASAASVVYTMQDNLGASVTVTCANMVPSGCSFSFSGAPYEQTQEYTYKGAATATDPITVSA